MNNIIQQIAKSVVENLEEVLINSLENKYNFADIVEQLTITGKKVTKDMLSYVLEELEVTIRDSTERKNKFTIHKREVPRKLLCDFGEIEFERTYYKNKIDGSYTYLLDNFLDIAKSQRIETNLRSKLYKNSTKMSYQEAVNIFTNGEISRQSVLNIIQEIEKIDNLELEIPEKKEVKELFIEADEDHVATQTKGNKEMKLISVYEGKEKESKSRRRTINKRSFTGTMSPEEIWFEVLDYIDQAYDLDKVKNIYIGGDGASWIKRGIKIIPKSKYVIDSYHLEKYLKLVLNRYIEETGEISEPYKLEIAINNVDHKLYKEALKNMEAHTDSSVNITNAYKYLRNQWEGIKNKIENPHVKISAEGQVSHILSSRLSSRPLGWSEEGMDKMARMRVYQDNGGDLEEYYLHKRKEKHKKARIIELDQKVTTKRKTLYNNDYIGTNIEILSKSSGKWLKQWLNTDFLKSM